MIPIVPIAFILAIRYYPNNLSFQIGQIQIVLGLLFLLGCWAFLNERKLLSGMLIGFAGSVKPQYLPLGLFALWNKEWKLAAGIGLAFALALALSLGVYGWNNHLDYIPVMKFLSQRGEYLHLNQSVNGIVVRFLYLGPSLDIDPRMAPQSAFPPYISAVYVSTVVSSALMLALPFFFSVRKIGISSIDANTNLIRICAACILFTMASPIAWVHHYNVLLPAYAVSFQAARYRWQGPTLRAAIAALAVSLFLTGYPVVPATVPADPSQNIIQSHVFFGALILLTVLFFESRCLPISQNRSLAPGGDISPTPASPSP